MNSFRFIFIIIYISSLFFCIFARIESWPFSDYRVFEGAYYPEELIVRMPYFKLSNGEYFNPGTKEFFLHTDRPYFDKAFRELKPDELESYLKQLILSKAVKRVKKEMIAKNLIPVKFVVMKITFKEKQKNLYVPVYTSEKEYDI